MAIELKRRQNFEPDIEIYYWRDYKDREVDFVVKKGLDVCQLIHVCSNIENPQTKEWETKSLIRAMYEFSVDTGMIITDDFEVEEVIKDREIVYIPLWKWLLM